MKELLNDIAVYNRKGTYKNTYELRPEYKSQSGRNTAMSNASMHPEYVSTQADEDLLREEMLRDGDNFDHEEFEEA